jgi:hypothetical protein
MAQEDKGSDTSAHDPGTGKGEEKTAAEGREAGRYDTGEEGADRPTGTSTARDSTGINPQDREPIDEDMPNMPPA